jgi:hypothetical protein
VVERQPSKLRVAGSNPVSRSRIAAHTIQPVKNGLNDRVNAHVAQSAEHILGKDEVTSSILVMGSTKDGVQRCFIWELVGIFVDKNCDNSL